MRTALIAFLSAIGLAPVAASAVVIVRMDDVNVAPTGADQIVWVDVWADPGVGDTTDEMLDAFTIAIDGPSNQQNGVRFLPPVILPPAAHPYVFQDFPGSEPADFGSTFNRMQVGAATAGAGQTANITDTRNGLFSIPVFIPGNAQPGYYPVAFDPAAFSLGGGPTLNLAVPGRPIVIIIGPEPSTLGFLPLVVFMLARIHRPARPTFRHPGG